jgi:RHS repeat-associated protein
MRICAHGGWGRLVGDPIDVVTGANIGRWLDLQLPGPLPLVWSRHYNSDSTHLALPLGRAQTHEYDHRLVLDVDGITWMRPVGRGVPFPPLPADGDASPLGGVTLVRVSPRVYRLSGNRPVMEFTFASFDAPARLTRLFRVDAEVSFLYDRAGRLEAVVDSRGVRLLVASDEAGRIVHMALARASGQQSTSLLSLSYDSAGNLTRGVDGYGASFQLAYDAANRLTRYIDRRGYAFLYEYDERGRCTRSRGQDGLHDVKVRYIPEARTTQVEHADGGTWTYFYDEGGAVSRLLDPYGGATLFEIGPDGLPSAEIDPAGAVTRLASRGPDLPPQRISPAGRAVPNSDDADDPWESRLADSPFEFELGDLFPLGSARLPVRDHPSLSRLPADVRDRIFTVPAGGSTRGPLLERAYNELGTMVRKVDGLGRARRFTYDAGGNVRRRVDRDGAVATYEFRGWNQLAQVMDSAGNAVRYRYTPMEQLASITDRAGSVIDFEYDLKQRLVAVHRNGAIRERYSWDAAGNLTEKRDGSGTLLVSSEYGPRNLRTARRLASGETHAYQWDARGRMTGVKTEAFELSFTYGHHGLRTSDVRDGIGVMHELVGHGTLRATTVLGRYTTAYRHAGGSVRVTDPTGRTHVISVIGPGVFERAFANGTREISQYDPAGRCLLKAVLHGSDTWIREYRYSAEGDLLEAKDSRNGTRRYVYDEHRLVESNGGGPSETYRYDPAGNLVEKPGLTGIRLAAGSRLAAAGGEVFDYDSRGRLASRAGTAGSTQYEYDSLDRLVSVKRGEQVVTFAYDPIGRRVSKTSGLGTTTFYWDGDRLAAELGPLGSLRIYVYADLLALVPLLAVDYESAEAAPASGRVLALFTDQLGAPILAEDDARQMRWRAAVEPYGTAHVDPDSRAIIHLRYPGHYHDTETGLHQNRFRTYSPELGRYLEPDPVGLTGGLNLYAYSSSPLSHVDVRGLIPCPACEAGKKKSDENNIPHEESPKPSELEPKDRTGRTPFDDLPPFENMTPQQIREHLEAAGFTQTSHEQTDTITRADGSQRIVTNAAAGSEIWCRRDTNGNYEFVRIDQHGHNAPGKASDPPHSHREYIPNDDANLNRTWGDKPASLPRNDDGSIATNPATGQPYQPSDRIVPPGTTSHEAADQYNDGYTPVHDRYDDNNQLIRPGDKGADDPSGRNRDEFKRAHNPISGNPDPADPAPPGPTGGTPAPAGGTASPAPATGGSPAGGSGTP